MDRQEYKNRHSLGNNKRHHDMSVNDSHYFELDLQFNPKRVHLDLSEHSANSNGIESRGMPEGYQLFAPFSTSTSLFATKNSDYALNLSKKYNSFHSLSFAKLPLPYPNLSYSPDIDAMPMDLSKGTREEPLSKDFKNIKRKDKVEKKVVMTNDERRKLIKQLQEELRIEESKLLLLKLIKRSQIVFSHNVKNGTALVTSSLSSGNHKVSSFPTRQGSSYSGDSSQKGQLSQTSSKSSHPIHGSQTYLSTSQSSFNFASSSFNCGTSYSRSCTPQTRTTPSSTPGIESSAQRQAAAKLVLRRQLEKTLIQIPPPKPLPPEMNFIPNASSSDFVALLGLEEVVKCILDGEARRRGEPVVEMKYVFNPFRCVQCSTDFTPVWKRDKPSSKNVICEKCVTTNQKRALKQEYTNRLKSAFVKALQQEQDIDRGLHSSSSLGNISPSSAVLANQSSLPSSLSSFMSSSLNPNHQKNFLQSDPLHRLTSDLASVSPLFPLPPSFWSLQNFSLGLSSSAAAVQALSQQLLFPFSGVLPKADMTHRQFLDHLPRKSQQLEGSPLLWRS